MKRMILAGKVGSGKTTLINAMLNNKTDSVKTQALCFYDTFIDTPGEYLELRSMYKALIVTASDADVIGLVQASGDGDVRIPPMFASIFPKDVIGIVTKTDIAQKPEDVGLVREILAGAGVSRIFEVSAFSGEGLAELAEFMTKE